MGKYSVLRSMVNIHLALRNALSFGHLVTSCTFPSFCPILLLATVCDSMRGGRVEGRQGKPGSLSDFSFLYKAGSRSIMQLWGLAMESRRHFQGGIDRVRRQAKGLNWEHLKEKPNTKAWVTIQQTNNLDGPSQEGNCEYRPPAQRPRRGNSRETLPRAGFVVALGDLLWGGTL